MSEISGEIFTEPFVRRSFTERYKSNRAIIKKKRDRDVERIMNLYKMLSFSVNSSAQSSSWRRENVVSPISVPEDLDITKCSNCKTGFSSFFGKMMKSNYQCPLCGRYVCNPKCCSHKITIESTFKKSASDINGVQSQGIEVPVCDNCFELVQHGKHKQQFKSLIEKSKQTKVTMCFDGLSNYASSIKLNQDKLQGLVNDIGDVHTKENEHEIRISKILITDLNNIYLKYEQLLKQLNTINPSKESNKRETTLLNNFKSAFVQFLQDMLPTFRILSKQIQQVEALPITVPVKKIEVTSPKTSNNNNNSTYEIPTIKSVYPSVVSLQGGKITVTGINFNNKMRVYINQQKAKYEYISANEIIVTAPQSTEGGKSIKIENNDGAYTMEDEVLMYTPDLPPTDNIDNNNNGSVGYLKNMFSSSYSTINDLLPTMSLTSQTTTTTEELFISMINPAASPLQGNVIMKLSGIGFDSKCKLTIGGKPVVYSISNVDNESVLSFNSPSFNNEGFQTVQITNKNGKTAIMNDGIYYYKDNSSTNTSVTSPSTSTSSSKGRVWGKR